MTSHRLKGYFLSKLKFISIYLIVVSVIQKNFYKFDRPGGRETAGLFFPPTEVVSHGNNTK